MAAQTSANNKGKQALGKGIRALLSNIDEDLKNTESSAIPAATGAAPAPAGTSRIPVDGIEPNPKQPRRDFEPVALQELADSIALHDIIQPITVVKLASGRFGLISGERRWRAARMAGLQDIPAYVRTADDQGLLEMALLENLQRENLNAIEIALSYKRLMDEVGLTQELVAERMKKERSTVANYLRLLRLPPDVQKAVRDGAISMGHARALIGLEHVDQQLYAFRETIDKGFSVRQTEQLVKDLAAEKPTGTAKTAKTSSALPPAYRRIEDNMASHFSTKVRLDRKKNGKGNVVIEFYSDEDLERILDKMQL
jgi:ParB family chromosome partitioning protein